MKNSKEIILSIIVFMMISILTIYSATTISHENDAYIKQIIWYIFGFLIIFILSKVKNDIIINNIWVLYIFGNLLLLSLLFFAPTINNAKCWFKLPVIGSFQPSEFMKIVLIITTSYMCLKFRKKYPKPTIKQEFIFLLKIIIMVAVPTILTFLEPDTGAVIIYLVIIISILFVSGIRYGWFLMLFGITASVLALTLGLYFFKQDLFINIFGNSMFLRIDRLLDWGTGFQLERGMTAMGSAPITGYGISNTPLYFPEAHTDFIFAVFASNFGLIGSIILLAFIAYFDIKLILLAKKTKNPINKYIISGIIGVLLFQQIQNIGMTLGIMPIMGITLPFISYGGSSLLSYMIIIGLLINIVDENKKYKNI